MNLCYFKLNAIFLAAVLMFGRGDGASTKRTWDAVVRSSYDQTSTADQQDDAEVPAQRRRQSSDAFDADMNNLLQEPLHESVDEIGLWENDFKQSSDQERNVGDTEWNDGVQQGAGVAVAAENLNAIVSPERAQPADPAANGPVVNEQPENAPVANEQPENIEANQRQENNVPEVDPQPVNNDPVAPPSPVISGSDKLSALPTELMYEIMAHQTPKEIARMLTVARTYRHVDLARVVLLDTGRDLAVEDYAIFQLARQAGFNQDQWLQLIRQNERLKNHGQFQRAFTDLIKDRKGYYHEVVTIMMRHEFSGRLTLDGDLSVKLIEFCNHGDRLDMIQNVVLNEPRIQAIWSSIRTLQRCILFDALSNGALNVVRFLIDLTPAIIERFDNLYEDACRNGHANIVALLMSRPNFRNQDRFIRGCLRVAITKRTVGVVEQLFSGDLEVFRRVNYSESNYRHSLIIRATKKNLPRVVELLMSNYDVFRFPVHHLNKAWTIAAENDRYNIMEILLQDLRVDILGVESKTFLRNACTRGKHHVVRAFLNDPHRRTDPGMENNLCLKMAVYNNKYDLVTALIADDRVDPNVDGGYLLQTAVTQNRPRIVSALLNEGRADPTADDNKALRSAIHMRKAAIVKALLEDGRVDRRAGFDKAISDGSADMVKLLLKGNSAENDDYALEKAMDKGDQRILKIFLGKKLDRGNGNLLLKAAVMMHDVPSVKRLLKKSNVDAGAYDNYAVRTACGQGDKEIVQLLLRNSKVDPAALSNQALDRATRFGHEAIVKMLLATNRVAPTSATLNHAVSVDKPDILALLLGSGKIKPNANNSEAFLYSCKWGLDRCVDVFLSYSRLPASEGGIDVTKDDYEAIRLAKLNQHDSLADKLLASRGLDAEQIIE